MGLSPLSSPTSFIWSELFRQWRRRRASPRPRRHHRPGAATPTPPNPLLSHSSAPLSLGALFVPPSSLRCSSCSNPFPLYFFSFLRKSWVIEMIWNVCMLLYHWFVLFLIGCEIFLFSNSWTVVDDLECVVVSVVLVWFALFRFSNFCDDSECVGFSVVLVWFFLFV